MLCSPSRDLPRHTGQPPKFCVRFPDFPGRALQSSDAVSAYTQLKLEDDPVAQNTGRPVVPFERHAHWAGLLWEQQSETVLTENGWTKVQNLGNVHSCTAKNGLMTRKQHCCKIKYTWDGRSVNASRRYIKQLLVCEKSHAEAIAWSHDMEGRASKCVERKCELANQKIKQPYKVSALGLDDHQFTNEGLETAGDLSNIGPQIVLNCLYLALIGRSDIFWSGNYLVARATTN